MHCLRPMLLTPAKNSQRDDHFCGRLSVYSCCYESGAVRLDSSSFILGGESIRKFDFWIGVFLSESSGSIQKSTSGSIRIYPKKSGTSGLLHHSSVGGTEVGRSCTGVRGLNIAGHWNTERGFPVRRRKDKTRNKRPTDLIL